MTEDVNFVDDLDLDISLDDIDDLPEYARVPTGAYRFSLPEGIEDKMIEAKDGKPPFKFWEVQCKLTEIVELKEGALDIEGELPPKIGDIVSFSYNKNNKFGVGNLKKHWLVPISKVTHGNKLGELLGASKGMEFLLIVKRVVDKKDPDKFYNRIVNSAAV